MSKSKESFRYELPIEMRTEGIKRATEIIEELTEVSKTLEDAIKRTSTLANELVECEVIITAELGEPVKADSTLG